MIIKSQPPKSQDWVLKNATLPQAKNSPWVCIDISEQLGVTQPKYGNPTETETLDKISFLFAQMDGSEEHLVKTRGFRQSSYDKSALMKFLTSWLGGSVPTDGTFSTDSLIGRGAMITVSHVTSQKGTRYAQIQTIAPVPAEMESSLPKAGDFTVPEKGDGSQPKPATSSQGDESNDSVV